LKLGEEGEQIAKDYLLSKGYELVAKNYRYERAETDLIVKDEKNKTLVFVEVKTRKTKTFGEPEDAVNEFKQAQLVKSAEGFMLQHEEYEDYLKRIDVIAIFIERGKRNINHIENAF